jgi:hypothetical protein
LNIRMLFTLFAGLQLLWNPAVQTGTLVASPQTSHAKEHPVRTKEHPARHAASPVKELAVPFSVGETLNYRVTWASFATAASLQVSVPERRNLFGWATWHFRASLHTHSPVRTLFTVDDEFDSYADAGTLETRQYECYANELGRKDNYVLHFVPLGQESRTPGPDVRVEPGTRDPVGILFALRGVDWEGTPEFHAPLYDGHQVYQVNARLEAKTDAVTVGAGTFTASRIGVRLSQADKEGSEINFELWLANNPARSPVQFQAMLPFGSVRAELMAPGK